MIQLNGFTPEQIEEINKELHLGWNRKAVLAEHRRRMIAEMNRDEAVWGDDFQVTMRMDQTVALYWKMREGNEVWSDSGHLKYFRKHFPEVFVKTRAPKTKVGYRGPDRTSRRDAETQSGLLDKNGRALAAA